MIFMARKQPARLRFPSDWGIWSICTLTTSYEAFIGTGPSQQSVSASIKTEGTTTGGHKIGVSWIFLLFPVVRSSSSSSSSQKLNLVAPSCKDMKILQLNWLRLTGVICDDGSGNNVEFIIRLFSFYKICVILDCCGIFFGTLSFMRVILLLF